MSIIDQAHITVDGQSYLLTIEPDTESHPNDYGDLDGIYSPSTIASFGHEWGYVGVVVERCSDGATASLWAVEYGQITVDLFIGRDNLINDPYMIVDGVSFTLVETLASGVTL